MKLSKRLLSLLLCIVMVLGAVPFSGVISFAEETCIHIDDNSDNICDECKDMLFIYSELDGDTVVNTVKDIPSTAVKITAETTALENGWSYVEGKVDISHTVSVQGTANLILCDGAELTVNGSPYYAGIYVTPHNTLNIYGQTRGDGILRVTAGDFSAAIGGSGGDDEGVLDVIYDAGDINIFSGCIYPAGDFGAASIGGAFGGDCGDITVAGGIIQPSTVGGNSGGLSVCFGEGYKDGAKAGSGTLSIAGGVVRAACDGGVARCKSVNVADGISVYDLKNNVYDYNLRINNPANPIKDALIGTLDYLKNGQSEFFDFSKFAIYEGQTTLDEGSFYYVIDNCRLPSTLYSSNNIIVLADHITLDSRAGKEFTSSKVYRQSEGSARGLFMSDYGYSESGQRTAIGNYGKYNGELSLTDGWYYINEDFDTDDYIELNGDVRFIISDGVTFSAYFLRNGGGDYTLYTESTGDKKGVITEKKKTYLAYAPDETTGKFKTEDLPKNYKVLGDGTAWGTDGETTWYFADSSKTFSSRIITQGDVHLVLKDGISLNCEWGITVPENSSLTIYAQSLDKTVMGSLTADGRHFHDKHSTLGDMAYPGIGNDRDCLGGNITVNGGNISAYGGNNCPGIGVCLYADDYNKPTITFNGGYVKAESFDHAAGIGTGSANGLKIIKCNIIINGGDITAKGIGEAAAIGIGESRVAYCDLFIGGGNIIADNNGSVPAIGKSGYSDSSSYFTMKTTCFVDIFDDTYKNSSFNTYGETIKTNGIYSSNHIRIVENGETGHRLKKANNPTEPVFDSETGEMISHGCLPYYQCDCGLYYSDPGLTQLIGGTSKLNEWKTADGICDECRVVKYLDYVDGEFVEAQIPESSVNYLNANSNTIGKSNQTTWYYAVADVYIDIPITVKGDVRLILKDGVTATSELGIQIDGSDSLTVYSQSQGENAGTLIGRERVALSFKGEYKGCDESAGIGNSHNGEAGGTVIFNGGNISALAGLSSGAAIGTGSSLVAPEGTFTIIVNGGNITAKSRNRTSVPAIGCGAYHTKAEMTVNGGSIKAVSEGGAPGIGMCWDCTFTLNVNGGSIYTESKRQSALGIKTDTQCTCGGVDININGGTVTAFSSNEKDAINKEVGEAKVNLNVNYCYFDVLAGSDIQSAEAVDTYTNGAFASFTQREEAEHFIKIIHPMELAVTDEDGNITEYGHKTYYECWCGNYYSDEACTHLIDDLDNWLGADGRTEYDVLKYTWNGESCTASFMNSITGETGPEYTATGVMETVSDETCTKERVCRYKAVFDEPDFREVTYSDNFEIADTKGHIDLDGNMYCDRCNNPYYLDENGVLTAPFDCSVTSIDENTAELTDGWYILDADAVFTSPLTINGNVKIILADDRTLAAEKGILLTENNSLTVYAQSADSNMGKIIAFGSKGTAGIGGNIEDSNAGNLTVNGGYVKAVGGYGAPGIGGGLGGENGTVVKNGGTIEAIDGENYGVPHEHTFDTEYSKNEFVHWYAATCEHTDLVKGMEAHNYYEKLLDDGTIGYVCMDCDFVKPKDEVKIALDNVTKALNEAKDALAKKEAELKTAEVSLKKATDDLEKAEEALNKKTALLNEAENNLIKANNDLETAKNQVTTLTGDLKQAQSDLTDANTALKEKEEQVAGLTADLEKAQSDLADANTDIDAKKAQIDTLTADLEKAQGELDDIKKALEDKQTEVDNLTEDLQKANSELTETKAALEIKKTEADNLAKDLQEANNELNETKAALEDKKTELGKLTAALEEVQGDLDTANTVLTEKEAQITSLSSDLEKANGELTDTKAALEKANADLEAAESEKANLETQLAAKKNELENLKESADAKDEAIKALEEEITGLEADIKTKDNEIAEKANAVTDLEKSVDDLEKTVETKNGEIAGMTDEIAELKDSIDELEAAIEARDGELGKKSNEITDLEKSIGELEKVIEAKDGEITEKANEITALENSVDELEKTVEAKDSEITEKTNAVAELEKSVAELEKTIEARDGEITEKANEVAELEKSIDELEKTVETKNGEIEARNGEIKALENDIAGLESAVEAKNGEIAARTEEIAALEGDISSLENEVNGARTELAEKNEQIENLNGELEKARAEIEELKNGEDTSCPYCGKEKHENFFDKVLCFFKRIFNFFRDLFRKIF